ncbi:reverse transcriptase domain-containing protein [Tanacetum coccineum]
MPDVAGRLQKWSVMLGEHNITYRPRTSVKGQILADFLVEKPDEAPPDTSVVETPQEPWTLFTDGSSCVDGSEYEALIAGLRIAAQMGVRNVHVSVDSKLVANQVLGTYVAKEENMIKYLEKAKSLISGFANFSISQVPRSKNKKADALSKIASTSFAHLSKQVLVEVLKEKSIQEEEVATMVEEEGPTWMTPIMEYLKDETLPDDRKEASKLRIKARQYELLEGYARMTTIRGGQSHAAGILLANHASGCTGYDTQIGTRKSQVFNSRYGLFYEVDRGESHGDNHRQSGEEVRVGRHSVPLRPPGRNSLRQRPMDSWREQIGAWTKELRPTWARETRIR